MFQSTSGLVVGCGLVTISAVLFAVSGATRLHARALVRKREYAGPDRTEHGLVRGYVIESLDPTAR